MDFITKPVNQRGTPRTGRVRAHVEKGNGLSQSARTGTSSEQRRTAEALREVKVLKGLVPICASCKKIRNDRDFGNSWKNTSSNIQRPNSATDCQPLHQKALSWCLRRLAASISSTSHRWCRDMLHMGILIVDDSADDRLLMQSILVKCRL